MYLEMKKCKKILRIPIMVILLIWAVSISAQEEKKEIKPVKIGDKAPNFKFKNMVNYPTKELELKDLEDKLVIINSWAYW